MESTRSRYGHFRCCYEASFSGTVLYDTLTEHGVDCAIIAPGSIPKCSGDRIKTERRDARNLSKYFGSGLLTECFVQLRAVRGLLRSREAQIKSLHQSKIRGIHFLHAHGHCYTTGRTWTKKFKTWIHQMELERRVCTTGHLNDIDDHQGHVQKIEQQVQTASKSEKFQQAVQILQGFRGIGLISAMQLVCEIGDVRRFENPTALMAYLGFVPSQHSSGNTIRTGSITKTGNTHPRKVLVSAPWKYIYVPRISVALQEREKHCSANVIDIRQKAQTRLNKRYNANLRKSRWLPSCVNWLAFSGRRCKPLLKPHKQPIR